MNSEPRPVRPTAIGPAKQRVVVPGVFDVPDLPLSFGGERVRPATEGNRKSRRAKQAQKRRAARQAPLS